MAPRKPKSEAHGLLSALKFIECGQSEDAAGKPMYETHCLLAHGQVVAFNGFIAAGHPIADDIVACPQTARIIAAMAKATGTVALTQRDASSLVVSGGKLRVVVPCADVSVYPNVMADAMIAPCNDALKEAFKMCSRIVKDSAPRVIMASIRLRAWTATATNGLVLFEYQHGIDLPEIIVPRMAATAIMKVDKPLVGFGYTPGKSATFWFEDRSWIRTQLFNEQYPNTDRLWRDDVQWNNVPPEMFVAAEALKEHGERIVFSEGLMHTADKLENAHTHGASYEVAGLPGGFAFAPEVLLEAAPFAQVCAFTDSRMMFYGPQSRGIVMGMGR